MFIPPLRIALSGGGIKGLSHIGALEVLQERGLLKQVREYIGISAGAFCAFCICIGCSLPELRTVITMLNFGLMRHLEPETIFRFPESFGFDDGANLDKLLRVILKSRRLSEDLTFEELASLSKKAGYPALRIFATDLNTCLIQEFSAAVTPRVLLRTALRATMAIPFYFTPVADLSGHLFVDGGVISNLPFSMLTETEKETTLCIAFSNDHKQKPEPIKDLATFSLQLFFSIHYHALKDLEERWGSNIVFLPCGSFSSVNFEASVDQKIQLLDSGRAGMEAFLTRQKKKVPPRRFSVA